MTEPTDADRKHAAELIYHNLPGDQVEAVARALAGERAKFLALADDMEFHDAELCSAMAAQKQQEGDLMSEAAFAMQAADLRMDARRIRRVAENSP